MSAPHHVLIGGGQAASAAAAKLRELDGDVRITMIGEEPVLPYQRPPLSKAYLSGDMPLERLVLRPHSWFDDQNVVAKLGVRATQIDRDAKTISLSDGDVVAYDRLLIATGSSARRLPADMGGSHDNVHVVRTLADADRLAPMLGEGGRLLVIGGGYIGLEAAAVARQAGLAVTIIEMGERILQRVASPRTSRFFRDLHARHGVEILEGVALDHFTFEGARVTGAVLNDGRTFAADHVICGIGIVPNIDIAAEAGLEIDNGIAVDDFCATSDPNIFAAGDCASMVFRDQRIRLESVPNAIHQAEVAVHNMLGQATPYVPAPWFWSDQYDVKLQIAGLNLGYTSTVIRPGKREGSQSVWYYDDGQLLAVDAMNDAPAFMMARRILEGGKTIAPNLAEDSTTNLKDFA